MKLEIKQRVAVKTLLWFALLALGITMYYFQQYGTALVGDAIFLSGLFFLCMALLRVVRHLGMFDNTIYGFKKIFRHTSDDGRVLDYCQYWAEHPYTQPVWEMLLIGLTAMVLGVFLS